MANIFDYVSWRGDLSFKQSPFNIVDNIILSRLSYLPFDGIVSGLKDKSIIPLSEAAAQFFQVKNAGDSHLHDSIIMKDDPILLEALAKSERFGKLGLSHYVNHIDDVREEQFSALTIHTNDGSTFVSYRGTDNTLVGWKEDFNMGFLDKVPA